MEKHKLKRMSRSGSRKPRKPIKPKESDPDGKNMHKPDTMMEILDEIFKIDDSNNNQIKKERNRSDQHLINQDVSAEHHSVSHSGLEDLESDSGESAEWEEQPPCKSYHFLKCSLGSKCPYSHRRISAQRKKELWEEFARKNIAIINKELKAEGYPPCHIAGSIADSEKPCYFFHIVGDCKDGDMCDFCHEELLPTDEEKLNQLAVRASKQNRRPMNPVMCTNFKKGCCKYGQHCHYLHIKSFSKLFTQKPNSKPVSRIVKRQKVKKRTKTPFYRKNNVDVIL